MRPTIRLWDGGGFGLIIEWPSGVKVSNQTGGTSCLHPEVEGVFVPLRTDHSFPSWTLLSPEIELNEYFEGPVHRGTGASSGLSVSDADFIDGILAKCGLASSLRVQRDRLTDSHEAWVYVTITAAEGGEATADDELRAFAGFDDP
jgi:hypothetical protein